MVLIDANLGLVDVEVSRRDTASRIGQHHAAVGHYLATGDDSKLHRFRNTRLRIGGQVYRPATDPEVIEDLALAGDLGYDDIYVLE